MLFSSFSHPGQSFGQSCSILWGLLFSSLGSPVSFLDSSVRSLGSPVQFFGQPCSVLCAVLHSSQGSPIQFCGQSCQLVLWAVMYCSFGSPLNHLCSPVQFPGQPCSVSLLFSVLNLPSSPSTRFGPERVSCSSSHGQFRQRTCTRLYFLYLFLLQNLVADELD